MYESPLVLETERMLLAMPSPDWAPALAEYRERNREYLRNAGPVYAADSETVANQMRRAQNRFAEGRAVSLVLFHRDFPDRVLGTLTFDRIVRGPMRCAGMGYGLDAEHEGQGYMSEAARRGIQFMFQDWGMHRLEADYQPGNERSGRLLRRLGFQIEGYARDYLYINGAWRDHIKMALASGNDAPPPDRDPVTGEAFPPR